MRSLIVTMSVLVLCATSAWAQDTKPRGTTKGIRVVPKIENMVAADYLEGDRYALVIGINNYKDEKIPNLTTCENDARGIYKLLIDPKVGGVTPKNATLLIGKSATTLQIKKQMAKLRKIPANSTIFVYFSGHGAKEADEAFWVTQDSEINSLSASGLADRELRAFLEKIPSDRVIVIIDACYAAATVNPANKTLANDFSPVLKKFTGKGRAFLMAAGSGEEAIEAKDLKHSVFTHYIIKGMAGSADKNTDGVIVLTELTDYIDRHVAVEARQRGGVQKPVASFLDVREPAKFRLAINAGQLRKNMLRTNEDRVKLADRLQKLKALGVTMKITVEQYQLGERLLNSIEIDLSPKDRKRLAEFVALIEGPLEPDQLNRALALIGPDDSKPIQPIQPIKPKHEPEPTKPKPTVVKPPNPPIPAPITWKTVLGKLSDYDRQISESLQVNLPTSTKVLTLRRSRQQYLTKHQPMLILSVKTQQTLIAKLSREFRPTATQVLAAEADLNRLRNALTISHPLGMKFVLIPAGSFMMGSPPQEPNREGNELQHRVTLTKAFYMGTMEVTQAQWQAIMGNNPSQRRGATKPVEDMTWNHVMTFLQKLSARDGRTYRLPTEAEWEYACRAGTSTTFYTGSGNAAGLASGWISSNSRGTTQPVGLRKPNAWGLYDMHGNIREWCSDLYAPYPNRAVVDPKGGAVGIERVLRGGSWDDGSDEARSAKRDQSDQDDNDNEHGFRIVLQPAN